MSANNLRQRAYENKTNKVYLDQEIKNTVDELDITVMLEKLDEYRTTISNLDTKFAEHHSTLINSIVKSDDTAIRTMLRIIIKEGLTSHSYIDRNVVANKIGRKLLPKSIRKQNAVGSIKADSVALSLGLNLVNYLTTTRAVTYHIRQGADNHSISYLTVNPILLPDSLQQRADAVRATSFMFVKPKPHTGEEAGGYLTSPQTMLNSSGFSSITLQSDRANEAMNNLQNVAYQIRQDWRKEHLAEYQLDDRWYRSEEGSDVKQIMTGELQKFFQDIQDAQDHDLYFPMAYDDRGRMYDRSTYIKYQGDKYQKSMLQFANKQTLTDEGADYLRVAIANELYSDKCSFDEALEWFDDQKLSDIVKQSMTNPIATSLVQDYIKGMKGEAIGTITHWDATNSALQFYSLLGKDKIGAMLCNIVKTEVIADAYGALASALNTAAGTDIFNRSTVKHAFMIFLYGGMEKQLLDNLDIIKDDKRFAGTHTLRQVFPTSTQKDAYKLFTAAMEAIAPSAMKLMNVIYTYNVPGTTKFKWTMPDTFKVEKTITATEKVKGYFMDKHGKTHEGSIEVKIEKDNAFSRALAPDIIHSIDAYFGREVIRRCNFDISFIHDSFGCHPNNAAKLMDTVKRVAAEILEGHLLVDILSQINPLLTKKHIQTGAISYGELTVDDVLTSDYIVR